MQHRNIRRKSQSLPIVEATAEEVLPALAHSESWRRHGSNCYDEVGFVSASFEISSQPHAAVLS